MCPQWWVSLRGYNNIVNEICVWRDESSDDCGKQAVTVQTWRGVADHSRLERRQPGNLSHCMSTAMYKQRRLWGWTQTMSSLDVCRPAEIVGEVRRRYTPQTLLNEKGDRAYSQSTPVLWASTADRADISKTTDWSIKTQMHRYMHIDFV